MRIKVVLSTRTKFSLLGLVVLGILYFYVYGGPGTKGNSPEAVGKRFVLAAVYGEDSYMKHLSRPALESKIEAHKARYLAARKASDIKDESFGFKDIKLVARNDMGKDRVDLVYEAPFISEMHLFHLKMCRDKKRWIVTDFQLE